VLFTIKDEPDIVTGIIWRHCFEKQRPRGESALMIGMRRMMQKEGEVIHVICDRIFGHGDLRHRVSEISFPHVTSRSDSERHARSLDRGEKGWSAGPCNCYWPPHGDGIPAGFRAVRIA